MGGRWHVSLQQILSEYTKLKYEMIIVSDTAEDAVKGVLEHTYEIDVFTKLLPHKVLHVIRWS